MGVLDTLVSLQTQAVNGRRSRIREDLTDSRCLNHQWLDVLLSIL
jgi:hypothetical protein